MFARDHVDQALRSDGAVGEPRFCVVGIGGAGSNIAAQVAAKDWPGVDVLVLNTDAAALARCEVATKLLLGSTLLRGYGTGGHPELGEAAAILDRAAVAEALTADAVLIVAGMGGGTGTGAAPVVAWTARERGAFALAVPVLPFSSEGRQDVALAGVEKLRAAADRLFEVHNAKAEEHCATFRDALAAADAAAMRVVETFVTDVQRFPFVTAIEQAEAMARSYAEEAAEVPVSLVQPPATADLDWTPVGFDETGFIGFR